MASGCLRRNSKLSPTLLPIFKPTFAPAMCRTSDGRLPVGHTLRGRGRGGVLGGECSSINTAAKVGILVSQLGRPCQACKESRQTILGINHLCLCVFTP